MNVREMHLDLDIGLRKINSSRFQNLLSEEKDFLLNQAVLQFIKNRRNPKSNPKKQGYEDTKKRYDDLEELLETITLPVYKSSTELSAVFAYRPYNCLLLDKDNSFVKFDCRDIVLTESSVNIYYTIGALKDGGTVSPFYSNFKIELTNITSTVTTLFDINNYPAFSNGFSSNEEKFLLISLVLEEINKTNNTPAAIARGYNVEVRWEKWGDIFVNNSFIFIVTDISTGLSINFTNVIITTGTTDTYSSATKVETKLNTVLENPILSPNRLTKTEEIYDLLNSSFGTTRFGSPLSKLERGKIISFYNKNFIIISTKVNFVRKPQQINLKLDRSCELNSMVHEEVVGLAIKKCKAILEAGNYDKIINENLNIE